MLLCEQQNLPWEEPTPLTRSDYSAEQLAAYLADLKESFWGDLQGQAWQALKRFLEVDAE